MGAQHWLGADDGPSHGVEAAQTRALEHPTRCRWHTLARCQSEIEKMLKDMEGPLSGGRKDLETSIASSGTAPSSSLVCIACVGSASTEALPSCAAPLTLRV